MLDQRILPLKHIWWYDPELPRPARSLTRGQRNKPLAPAQINKLFKHGLTYRHSRYWKSYKEIPHYKGGYFVELYPLSSVALRYGLSTQTKTYWRKHILPEPFQALGTSNHKTFYWSRIQLAVVDTVLRHLEKNGIMTIRRGDIDCLDLIDHGCSVLEAHYASKYEQADTTDFDAYGVRKIE